MVAGVDMYDTQERASRLTVQDNVDMRQIV